MSYKTRTILFIFFFLIFIITTPLVSLYATGYKIGDGFMIQKTGMLILDTEPKNAQIYINGEVKQKFLKKIIKSKEGYIKTPAKIKNLAPGKYNIRFELDGYWPWEKNLEVKPGESTFAEDVNLFKKNLPLMILSGELEDVSLSPNKEYLITKQKNQTNIINLKTEEVQLISTSTEMNIFECSWSAEGEKAVINHEICDANNIENKQSVTSLLGDTVENIKWDSKNENIFFYVDKGRINSYNVSQKTNQLIAYKEDFDEYLPKDNYIYLISNTKNQSSLKVWDTSKNEIIKSIEVPKSSYIFIHPEHKFINLLDQKHNILYLIDPSSSVKPLYDSINGVKKVFWIDDDRMLFANDFEIWKYNTKNGSKNLLTRISNKIDTIFWHPSNNYVIYSTNKNINIIELDDREKYNITKLFEIDTIKYVNSNEKGDILYFYTEIGQQKGLYKLAIQ